MKPLLLVDGYNIIGAWSQADRAAWPLHECRDRLIHLLEDYAGYTAQEVVVVFDGYKGDKPISTVEKRGGLSVVYTKRGQTADQYIEAACQGLPPYREARVATSDRVEQTLILGRGATRLSARELLSELQSERSRGRDRHSAGLSAGRVSLFDGVDELTRQRLEAMRRNNKE